MRGKTYKKNEGAVSLRQLAGLALFCLWPILLLAGVPDWWTTRNVTSGAENDYAAVNQGQLKNIALKAYLELQANLPGGVGDTSGTDSTGTRLNSLIMSWGTFTSGTFVPYLPSKSDYAAVNIGQVKYVVKPFYDRLIEVGYTYQYPWTGSTGAVNDYAMANIGQVKYLFNFDLTHDSMGDGVPDWWEKKYFGSGTGNWLNGTTTAPSGAPNSSGVPMTVGEAYSLGVSPIDYYNGTLPALTLVSGTSQTGIQNTILPSPLVVSVTGTGGQPLVNAPVVFYVSGSAGTLSVDSSGTTLSSTFTLRTGTNGQASIYFQLPDISGTAASVTVAATSGTQSVQQIFSEATLPVPTSGLKVWLDAGTGVTSGSAGLISQWNDLSGNGNNATQSGSANQPRYQTNAINGLPEVTFNGTNSYLSLPYVQSGSALTFVVVTQGSNYQSLVREQDSSGWIVYPWSSSKSFIISTDGGVSGNSTGLVAGAWNLGIATYSSTGQMSTYLNGSLVAQRNANGSALPAFSSPYYLGAQQGTSEFANASLSEVLIYNRVLSGTEMATIDAYLNQKYQVMGAPANLSVNKVSSTQTVMSWTPNSIGTGIRVERMDGTSGTYSVIAALSGTSLSYIDQSLTPGEEYTYRICTTGSIGNSAYTTPVSITTDSDAPTLPTNGMQLWLSAANGVISATNGQVSSWNDLSGNGNNAAQSGTSYQPQLVSGTGEFNGNPGLRFNNSYLSIPHPVVSGTSAFTWVYVAKWNSSPTAYETLMTNGAQGANTTGYVAGVFSSDLLLSNWWDNNTPPDSDIAKMSGGPVVVGQSLMEISTYDGAVHRMWINGVNQGNAAKSDSAFTGGMTSIGCYFGNNHFAQADIAEIIVYNRILNESEMSALGTYLNGKYGILGNASSPSGLIANPISGSQVGLFWNYAIQGDSLTQFTIERAMGSGSFAHIATVDQSVSYIDSSAIPGVMYTYRVRASNYGSLSSPSNTASVTTSGYGPGIPLGALTLWLKGDCGVTGLSNGNVYAWIDQSGNNHDAMQSGTSYQPQLVSGTGAFNGRSALRFNNSYLSTPTLAVSGTSAFTWVYVAKWNSSPSAYETLMTNGARGSANSGYVAGVFSSDLRLSNWWDSDTTQISGGGIVVNQPVLEASTYDGTFHQMWINGVYQDGKSKSGSNFASGSTVIGSYFGSGYFANADIAEVMVFNRALTETELAALYQYLAVKYLLPDFDVNGDGLTNAQDTALGLDPLGNPEANGDGLSNSTNLALQLTPPTVGSGGGVLTIDPSSPYLYLNGTLADSYTYAQRIALGANPFAPYTPPSTPPSDPSDHTSPTITLTEPKDAVILP